MYNFVYVLVDIEAPVLSITRHCMLLSLIYVKIKGMLSSLTFEIFITLVYMYQAIDAIDNGINQYDTDQPPRYVNNTHLSSRVGRLNLDWIDPDQSPERENEAFHQAMALAGSEFLNVRLCSARHMLQSFILLLLSN